MPRPDPFAPLRGQIRQARPVRAAGRVAALSRERVEVTGLARIAALGDRVTLDGRIPGEVVTIDGDRVTVLAEGSGDGLKRGAAVIHDGPRLIAPGDHWLGRVVDPDGAPLDGRPLAPGPVPRPLDGPPPDAVTRRGFGARLATGLAGLDTLLPLARGQRLGLFAGSGVGKSTLLGRMARQVEADVVVIGLIGERGREVSDFVARTLGPGGLARAVVVAATSDRPALVRRRAGPAMLAVAEHFRDQGRNVLLLCDSITRFAEAEREVAVASGARADLNGFPASTAAEIMGLCERSGVGGPDQGDITAVFSVLVAGSNMEGPIADILRGVLDGHVVLDRAIAERGRFPAIDALRSVSRSLPFVASAEEMALVGEARRILGTYAEAELMVKAGLYERGADALTDRAIALWPALDTFLSAEGPGGPGDSFARLADMLDPAQGQAASAQAGSGAAGSGQEAAGREGVGQTAP